MIPFKNKAVEDVFAAFPHPERDGLLALRALIFSTAQTLPEIGPIDEALRWGQPAYLTSATKSGSTLRLGLPKTGGFAIYAHCQTTIISDFVTAFAGMDKVEGNRAIHFSHPSQIDPGRHGLLIASALRYHL